MLGGSEDLALDQEQGYEQASDSAIAVKERVNSFELIMSQRNGHERRQGRFMQGFFPGRETRLDLSWRWWDVGSSRNGTAGFADPILNPAKTSGRCLVTLNARHEFFVQLAVSRTQSGSFLRREIPCSRATT